MRYAIAEHNPVPIDYLSGFNNHPSGFAEINLVDLGVYSFYLTGGLFGLFGTLYLIKILTIIATSITIFLIAAKLTKNNTSSLLAVLFYALSQLGIYYDAFNIWLGYSSEVSIILISILLLIYGIGENNKSKAILFYGASLASIIFGYVIWNGGGYVLTAYVFVIVMLLLYFRLKDSNRTFLISSILVFVMWLAILNMGNIRILKISTGFLALPPAGGDFYLNSIRNAVFQANPEEFWVNEIYRAFLSGNFIAKIPYLIWAATSFLSITLLAILCIKRFKPQGQDAKTLYVSLICLIIFSLPFVIESYVQFIYLPIIILGGVFYSTLTTIWKKRMLYLLIVLLPISLTFTILSIVPSVTTYPVGLSPELRQACLWLSNNTPPNSKILASYLDGPAIEYWGNRTSYTDTNIENNYTAINAITKFLYDPAYNLSYLEQVHPNYLLLRDYDTTNQSKNGTNIQLFNDAVALNITQFGSNSVQLRTIYANNLTSIYQVYYTENNTANVTRNPSNILAFYNFLYARAGNFTYLLDTKPKNITLNRVPQAKGFNGSNIQYLIEWSLNSKPDFSYSGIRLSLAYSNFSLSKNQGTITFRLSYGNSP